MSKSGITGKLKEGDIIHVGNPLRAEKDSYFKVNKVEGNIAYTGFRKFNTNIYLGQNVYEYGRRYIRGYSNSYTISSLKDVEEAEANVQ